MIHKPYFNFRFLILFILLLSSGKAWPDEKPLKKIELEGLKVYTEEALLKNLKISKIITPDLRLDGVVSKISRYYHDQGYLLIKIYIIENSPERLYLYIDEGRLDRIVFHRLNTLNLIKMKYRYSFYKNIFNQKRLEKIIQRLKEREGYDLVRYNIIPSRSFDSSLFQLDRELNIPVIGVWQIPFFEKYKNRFYIDFQLEKSSPGKDGGKKLVEYDLTSSYAKGLIPGVKYYRTNLLDTGDKFKAAADIGIMYGFDRKFNEYPRMTFFQTEVSYQVSPIMDIFTPLVKNILYRSDYSRKDIGISSYKSWLVKSLLAPGFTFLKNLEIYSGAGVENAIIWGIDYMPGRDYRPEIISEKNNYPYFETGFELSRNPHNEFDILKQKINFIYTHYYYVKFFNLFEAKAVYDHEFDYYNIYSIKFSYKKLWGNVPFYHEESVTSQTFKGFMGQSYYSRHLSSMSNEIFTSIYREFMYLGIYFDTVAFMGSGYDLSGIKYGIAGGPGFKVLLLDHFEGYIYFGRDLLLGTGLSHNNLNFGLNKKW